MPNRFLEWLGRVVMLSLAGMITLSIIGAISAIPSGRIAERLPFERAQLPAQPDAELQAAREGPPEAQANTTAGAGEAGPPTFIPAPVQGSDESGRWLETIAYALLALVGIAALATLLLLRSLAQRRRIAEALEALAQR